MEDEKGISRKNVMLCKSSLSNLTEGVCVDNCRMEVCCQVPNHSETSALPVVESVIKKAMELRSLAERVRRAQDLQWSVVTQR